MNSMSSYALAVANAADRKSYWTKHLDSAQTMRLGFELLGPPDGRDRKTFVDISAFHDAELDQETLLVAAWLLVCSRIRRDDNVAMDVRLSGESCEPFDLPLHLQIDPELTAESWLHTVSEQLVGHRQHGVVRKSLRDWQDCPRQNTGFEFQEFRDHDTGIADAGPSLLIRMMPEDSRVAAEFDSDIFKQEDVVRLLKATEVVFGELVRFPERRVGDLEIISTHDRDRLAEWNSTEVDYPITSICKLIETRAKQQADLCAVISGDKQRTYGELLRDADRVATTLIANGLKVGEPVAFITDRCVDFLSGVVGILRAGGVYLPMDPTHPDARLRAMLSETETNLVLASSRYAERFSTEDVCTLGLTDAIASAETSDLPTVDPNSTAYIMFTSGSTGHPKGVQIRHRNLVNQCRWFVEHHGLSNVDRVCQFSSIGFDISIEEIFPSLVAGATVVLRDDDFVYDPLGFNRFVAKMGITTFSPPTAFWHEWINGLQAAEKRLPSNLRLVVIGGEKAAPDVWASWRSVGGDQVQLVNSYGPTEATVSVTYFKSDQCGEYLQQVPIGYPQANTQIHILDHQGKQLPIGSVGELFIGGANVSAGYLNQPRLTNEKFIPDPFADSDDSDSPHRMYNSGDLGCWNEDGQLMISGRVDGQMKIGGFRVEISEVEMRLVEIDGIEQVFVAGVEQNGLKTLVAWCVAEPELFDVASLRSTLRKSLPPQWIPRYFLRVERLPLNVNGKVDKHALPPIPEAVVPAGDVVDWSCTEQKVASIFADVLQHIDFGIDDNFFEIGGDSLGAVALVSRIDREFGRSIAMYGMVSGASVRSVAALVDEGDNAKSWSPLCTMRSGDERPPLYFVPEITGDPFRLRSLAEHMEEGQAFVALQTPGYVEGQTPFDNIPDLAEYFVGQIVQQRAGPYYIGGFCFGAAVAFEMARQLEERGEQVAFLGLVEYEMQDSPYLRQPIASPIEFARRAINGPRWIAAMCSFLGPKWVANEFLTKFKQKFARSSSEPGLSEREKAEGKIPDELRDIPQRHRDVWVAHEHAANTYESKPYSGQATFIQAKTRPARRSLHPVRHWKEICLGGVSHELIRGFHQRILHEPTVRDLAKVLNRTLRTAQQAAVTERTS